MIGEESGPSANGRLLVETAQRHLLAIRTVGDEVTRIVVALRTHKDQSERAVYWNAGHMADWAKSQRAGCQPK